MANIDQYLDEIELASRGEEVRDSIINAFEALNSEGPGTMDWDNITDTPDTLTGYGVSEVPASMVSGVLALNNIPPSALERVVPVADDTARFALTSSDVQNGDTVKVLSTLKLYLVVDDTSLSTEAGYEEYRAGTADSVDWSGVLNTPDTLAGYGIEDAYTKDEVDDITTSEEEESEAGNPIVIETDAAQYAKKTHLTLAPVQDLHGYDHPWPAGGGKNLLDESLLGSGSTKYNAIYVGDGTFTLSTTAPKNNNDSANLFFLAGNVSSGIATDVNGVWNGNPQTVQSQNGYVTVCDRTVDGIDISDYKTLLEKGSTVTAYEPYSNICPITPMGHRNLLQVTAQSQTVNGVTFTVNADGTIIVNGTASSQINFIIATTSPLSGSYVVSGCPKDGSISTYSIETQRAGAWSGSDYGNGVKITTSEQILRSFIIIRSGYTANNLIFKPMIRLASDFDSTFVPYGMVRVGAKVTGFNIWDEEWEVGGYSEQTGAKTTNASYIRTKNLIHCFGGKKYYAFSKNSQQVVFYYYDSNLNYISFAVTTNAEVMAPSNARWIGVRIEVNIAPYKVGDICINISDAEKNGDYEPYISHTASLDLPEPVYSGTLDLETGEVVADMALADMDADFAYARNTSYASPFFQATLSIADENKSSLTTLYKYGTFSETVANDKTYTIVANTLRIRDDDYDDATAFRNAMRGQKIAFHLKTPITYQLTPQQLALFRGINNISTNAKTIQVTYRNGELATTGDIVASTEVAKQNAIGESASYTDARLATELAPILGDLATAETSTASASHAVGEYLLYNNRLYKVLAAISAGQQLTIGTNIEQTSVAAELTRLNSLLT